MTVAIRSLLLFLLLFGIVRLTYTPSYGDPGTIDFVQYHSAFRILLEGGNPYDPALILEAQRKVGFEDDTPIMMWNPPWLLTLMAPVLIFDFHTSVQIWLSLQILCYLLFPILLAQKLAPKKSAGMLVFMTFFVFVVPATMNIYFGQPGPLLFFGAFLLMTSMRNTLLTQTGIALALLSIKPHLLFIFVFALLLTLPLAQLKKIIGVSTALLGLICVPLLMLNVHVLTQWLGAMIYEPSDVMPRVDWATQTLASVFRYALLKAGFSPPTVIMYLPLALATLALLAYRLSGQTFKFDQSSAFVVLILSILASPYGWIYDQVLLLPGFLLIVLTNGSWRRKNVYVVIGLSLLYVGGWLLGWGLVLGAVFPIVIYASCRYLHAIER